ncbi:zinc finger, SWIM-type, partial [hydrothermal vent metagenome]
MAYDGYGRWPKYVPVAQRRAKADKAMQKLGKKGLKIEPIKTEGRKIARTFWGKAWCDHLEKFSDYENRLPRGRTYVRNGSVCHLAISKGSIEAIVSGSELYNINIDITPLSAKKWQKVREQCAGQIGSMLELLQGRFSDNVMKIVTDPEDGLFPQPSEIKLDCDCPDWADMCKHIAAVLYGVGARLDQQPELLFLLRNVDQEALISAELDITSAPSDKGKRRLATADLSNLFDIEMDEPVKPRRKKQVTKKKT